MKYRLVIFDFDGTLADTLPWFTGVMNQVADRYRFRRIEAGEHELLRGYEPSQIIQHLGVPVWRMPFIARYMRSLMNAQISQIRLFEEVDRLLNGLAGAGATLAIVSSNSEANVRAVLGPTHAALMARYECGVSMFGKASRLKRVLAKTRIPAEEAIYVGDEIRDLLAARSAHVASGAVSWGYNTRDALKAHSPTELFDRVDDILAAVLGNQGALSRSF
jgi:phosphoglycolate phosphatase